MRNTEHCHRTVYLNNNTDKPVYFYYSYNYPDTSLYSQMPAFNSNNGKIGAYGRETVYSKRDCVEGMIKYQNPAEIFTVFVFDAALVDSTPWEQIKQNYMILKRYDYNLDELRNTDFSIDFQ